MRDPAVLERVHQAAAAAGCVAPGEGGRLEVAALAESALRRARRNPGGLLYRLLEQPARSRSVSASDEDRARRTLRQGYGNPYPCRPVREPEAAPQRERQRGEGAVGVLLDRLVAAYAVG